MFNGKAPEEFLPCDLIDFEPGSTVLVLGGAWISNESYLDDILLLRRTRQVRLVVGIYDVSRAKFPHMYPAGLTRAFIDNTRTLLQHSDLVLTDSECAAADIREFAKSEGISVPRINVFRLGDEIEHSLGVESDDLEPITKALDGAPFVLCVSAIDTRKNICLLYDIWMRMREEYGNENIPHLVLVGCVSYSTGDLRAQMSKDMRATECLHIFHDLEDGALDWLYRHCQFTVYPSLYEGFGLPVAESLAYGKVCIASDASSVPEIAPEYTDLIDPLDFSAWYKRILMYTFSDELREKREAEIKAGYKVTTWKMTAMEIGENLKSLSPIITRREPDYALGTAISFARDVPVDAVPCGPFLAGGWGIPEATFSWTVLRKVSLVLNLPEKPDTPVLVLASVSSGNIFEDRVVETNVEANGRLVSSWKAQGLAFRRALVPASTIDQGDFGGRLELVFEIEGAVRPADVSSSNSDKRLLGLQFFNLSLHSIEAIPLVSNEHFNFRKPLENSTLEECGWGISPREGIFMTGAEAILAFEYSPAEDKDMALLLDCELASAENTFSISVNCHNVGQGIAKSLGGGKTRVLVPKDCFTADGPQIVEFQLENAEFKNAVDFETYDSGLRGLTLRGLAFQSLSEAASVLMDQPDDAQETAVSGDIRDSRLRGWSFPQRQGVWTAGEKPWLGFAPAKATWTIDCRDRASDFPLVLDAQVKPILDEDNSSVTAQVEINGVLVDEWTFNDPGLTNRSVVIPTEVLDANKNATVVFVIHEHGGQGRRSNSSPAGLLVLNLQVAEMTEEAEQLPPELQGVEDFEYEGDFCSTEQALLSQESVSDSALARSNTATSSEVAPLAQKRVQSFPEYSFGEKLMFGQDDGIDSCLGTGWCQPGSNGTWTEGAVSQIALSLNSLPSNDTITLTACLKAFVNDLNPLIEVDALVNDILVAQWIFNSGEIRDVSAQISAAVLEPKSPMTITFKISGAESPRDLGIGIDTRRLGLHVQSLLLSL